MHQGLSRLELVECMLSSKSSFPSHHLLFMLMMETRYQKNEKNTNLLNNYQLEITVKDAAGLEVGAATKQSKPAFFNSDSNAFRIPETARKDKVCKVKSANHLFAGAAEPLMVVDTALPFNLIVDPGATDKDPVGFWYSDQYWLSSQSQCSFGKYDSGSRQGDCSFQCPLPASPAPASATIANPLPAKATAAMGGATSFKNDYITSTTAPPAAASAQPSAPPKPNYATGYCGAHVIQYQKDLNHNTKDANPTTNYEVQVTLFDGNKALIPGQADAQIQAPTGQAIQIPGMVQKFTVTAGGVDSDPLQFAYGTELWNSSSPQCDAGKYDSGKRNMDCGFSC